MNLYYNLTCACFFILRNMKYILHIYVVYLPFLYYLIKNKNIKKSNGINFSNNMDSYNNFRKKNRI